MIQYRASASLREIGRFPAALPAGASQLILRSQS
jgi:hypothetical protein